MRVYGINYMGETVHMYYTLANGVSYVHCTVCYN